MSAYRTISNRFYGTEAIVKDILDGIPSDIAKDSIAFLNCDSQIEYAELLRQLHAKLPYTIVGGTMFTAPYADGLNEISAELTVLERDGLIHSVGISEPLGKSFGKAQIHALYTQTIAKLAGEAKLLMLLLPLVPGISEHQFVSELSAVSNGTPLFGGIYTNDLMGTRSAVFKNDCALHDRVLLLALGGDIQPVFSVGAKLTPMSAYSPTVTKAAGNIVYKVDDMTFCEYLHSIGVSPEERSEEANALMQYGPLPCIVRDKTERSSGIPAIRCIVRTNPQEGSSAFSAEIREGSRISIGVIQKNDVIESSRSSIKELRKKMAQQERDGYQYSMLFSIPCVARYFAMLGSADIQSKLAMDSISQELAVSAYYGYSEMVPVESRDGKLQNRSFSASVAMCAI